MKGTYPAESVIFSAVHLLVPCAQFSPLEASKFHIVRQLNSVAQKEGKRDAAVQPVCGLRVLPAERTHDAVAAAPLCECSKVPSEWSRKHTSNGPSAGAIPNAWPGSNNLSHSSWVSHSWPRYLNDLKRTSAHPALCMARGVPATRWLSHCHAAQQLNGVLVLLVHQQKLVC
jgi:hypothetical protein